MTFVPKLRKAQNPNACSLADICFLGEDVACSQCNHNRDRSDQSKVVHLSFLLPLERFRGLILRIARGGSARGPLPHRPGRRDCGRPDPFGRCDSDRSSRPQRQASYRHEMRSTVPTDTECLLRDFQLRRSYSELEWITARLGSLTVSEGLWPIACPQNHPKTPKWIPPL